MNINTFLPGSLSEYTEHHRIPSLPKLKDGDVLFHHGYPHHSDQADQDQLPGDKCHTSLTCQSQQNMSVPHHLLSHPGTSCVCQDHF